MRCCARTPCTCSRGCRSLVCPQTKPSSVRSSPPRPNAHNAPDRNVAMTAAIATQRPGVTLRLACRDDVPLILTFIRELAQYEREPDAVRTDEATLAANLFGAQPGAEVVIAEVDGQPAGFALFFHNFSTW